METTTGTPKKKSYWIISLVSSLLLILLLIPTFLSTSWAKNRISSYLSQSFHANVSMASIELSWFFPMHLDELTIEGLQHEYTIHVAKISKASGLLPLLVKLSKSPIEITNANFTSANSTDMLKISKAELQLHSINSLAVDGSTISQGISNPFSFVVSHEGTNTSWKGSAVNVTTAPLDKLLSLVKPSYNGLLPALLGPSFSYDTQGTLFENTWSTLTHLSSNNGSLEMNYAKETKSTLTGHWTLSRKILSLLASPTLGTKLSKDPTLTFDLNTLAIPAKNEKLQIDKSSFEGTLQISDLNVQMGSISQSYVLNSSFKTPDLSKELTFDVTTNGAVNSKNSSFILHAEIDSPLKATLESIKNFKLNAERFPSYFLDFLSYEALTPSLILGPEFSLQSTYQKQEGNTLTFSLNSTQLQVPTFTALVTHKIRLEKPAAFSFIPSTDLLKTYSMSAVLKDPSDNKITGTISDLSFSLDNPRDTFILAVEGFAPSTHVFYANLLELQKTSFNMKLKDKKAHFSTINLYNLLNLPNDLALVLGNSYTCQLQGEWLLDKEELTLKNVHVRNESDRVVMIGECDVLGRELRSNKDWYIEWTIDPRIINSHLVKLNPDLTILPFDTAEISLDAPLVYLDDRLTKDFKAKASLSLKKADIVDKNWKEQLQLRTTTVSAEINTYKNLLDVIFNTHLKQRDESIGNVYAALKNKNFKIGHSVFEQASLTIDCNKVSTLAFEVLSSQKHLLPYLIGPSIDLHLLLTQEQPYEAVRLSLDSKLLFINGELLLNDKLTLGSSPLEVKWTLTTEGYNALRILARKNSPGITNTLAILKENTVLNTKITKLEIPVQSLLEKKKLHEALIDLDLSIDKLVFSVKTLSQEVGAKDISLTMKHASTKEPFIFTCSAQTAEENVSRVGTSSGKVFMTGTITPEIDPNTPWKGDFNARIDNFPTSFLDIAFYELMGLSVSPSSIFGTGVSMQAEAHVVNGNGPITASFRSDAAQAELSGISSSQGLTLSKPLQATFMITPALSNKLLSKFDLSDVRSSAPLVLTINPNGFFLPWNAEEVKRIAIPPSRLLLGEISCKNRGSAGDIGGIFKLPARPNEITRFWFAPMDFKVAQGKLIIDRTEILYNRAYQVALWGQIDLVKSYVDMILGLTAQSLDVALGIKNLPSSYVLQIPVKGPYGNVKIDKGLATTRIAFLIARSTNIVPKNNVFGGLVDVLGSLADDQGSVPKPKPPFPWQK